MITMRACVLQAQVRVEEMKERDDADRRQQEKKTAMVQKEINSHLTQVLL